jgi:hypothetical protein
MYVRNKQLKAMMLDGPMHAQQQIVTDTYPELRFPQITQPRVFAPDAALRLPDVVYRLTHITSRGWLIYEWRE